ncbi:MAG: DNA mismatch repair protein MutL, partial [Chitinophagaceae bacterium]|nr:DNA mismatch repair protein MutL [Chitinophagaceae bacterium]
AKKEQTAASSLYQTFTQKNQAHFIESKSDLKHWKDFFPAREKDCSPADDINTDKLEYEQSPSSFATASPSGQALKILEDADLYQIHFTYLVAPTNQGFLLIHQQAAHERILYERYVHVAKEKPIATQRSLFPLTVPLSTADAILLLDLLPDLKLLGYEIESSGKDSFVIQGTPADVEQGNEQRAIEQMLEQYKHFSSEVRFSKREKLIRSMAWQHSIKPGKGLSQKEMKLLAEQLFACSQPNITPSGNPTYIAFKRDYLERMFGK